jgi:uncharacterized protein YcfJ
MMLRLLMAGLLGGGVLALGACTTTGNVERNAAAGAAAGAALGAIIGNNTGDGDATDGAVIGAVIGAGAGALKGRQDDIASGEGTKVRQTAQGQTLYYDERAGRYFYVDPQSGKTYWQNGQLRG